MSLPPGFTAVDDDVPAGFTPLYSTTNQKDASGAATVDQSFGARAWRSFDELAVPIPGHPIVSAIGRAERDAAHSLATVAKHLWDGVNPVKIGQLLPFPQAAGGSGTDNPLSPKKMADDLYAVKKLAQAAMAKGDYVTAIAKYAESVIPVLGPWMSKQGDQLQRGEYAATVGDALALAGNMAAPKGLSAAVDARYPLAGRAAVARPGVATSPNPTVRFAAQHDIPLDAATVSDNLAVKGVQAIADRSLGGSLVATPARAEQAAAMTRAAETLAGEVHPVPVTPEQGGLSARQALAGKIAEHSRTADTAYERIRELEQQPGNRMTMPGKPTPMEGLPDNTRGQLRRIVHELDAAPYTPRILQPGQYGSSMEHVEGTGGAGAAVFDDIVQRAGSHATRGTVQSQLETYLGGGPETPLVKAALEVADERNKARGGYTVTKPELPPTAMDVPTKLEGHVRGEEMGFPVDVKSAKVALKPVSDQMKRQLPITQQQANPGLKAIQNILDGPDYGSLSQIDRDLSAIKTIARQQGGLAKLAVTKLEAAVNQAAQYGGPEVVDALKQGRAATTAKYAVSDVLEQLHEEPVKAVKALTAPKDSAIQQLRSVVAHVPEQAPIIARAYLEDLLEQPQKVASWRKLGDATKRVLFPEAGQVDALDQFFTLTDRISKTNVNPSGSGYVATLTAQGMQLLYDPLTGAAAQISGAALAKLLRSPAAIRALTQGLSLSGKTPAVVQAATVARILRTARDVGVPIQLPQAAEDRRTGDQP